MQIKDITSYLESIAPLSYQESYDNSGLIVGSKDATVKKALLTLDCTESVVDEAIREKCQLIIAHHPIVFSGMKKFNGKTYVERVVMKAIKNDIAIYAIHTNYDNVMHGVNAMICEKLDIIDYRILAPKKGILKKLYTFTPVADHERVRQALCDAGAGHIGHYSETTFSSAGMGTFKGDEHSNPTIGKKGQLEQVDEVKLEVIFPAYLQHQVIAALLKAHPYEEVAYDIISIDNELNNIGAGMIGRLKKPMDEATFLKKVKKQLKAGVIKHTPLRGKTVETVAVCGGAGRFLLTDAIASKADIYITSDVKYHEFFDADGQIVLADIGHYESEQFTPSLLYRQLSGKFATFAFLLSKVDTNPVNYI
ncbi:MAG: dinuclear metal center protein YbgI/SA1388 family [Bacteroidetes bacterium]|nr:dinuclear metal center protein YbgI/SA1388 family [Bacteroidota bacterium]